MVSVECEVSYNMRQDGRHLVVIVVLYLLMRIDGELEPVVNRR